MVDDPSLNPPTGGTPPPKKRNSSSSRDPKASDEKPRRRRRRRPRKPSVPKESGLALPDLSLVESEVLDQLQQPSPSVLEREQESQPVPETESQPVSDFSVPYPPEGPTSGEFVSQEPVPPIVPAPEAYNPSLPEPSEGPYSPAPEYTPSFQAPPESYPSPTGDPNALGNPYPPAPAYPPAQEYAPSFQAPVDSAPVPPPGGAYNETPGQSVPDSSSQSSPDASSSDFSPAAESHEANPAPYNLSYSLEDEPLEDSSVADYSSPIGEEPSEPDETDSESFRPSPFAPSSPFQDDFNEEDQSPKVSEEEVRPPSWENTSSEVPDAASDNDFYNPSTEPSEEAQEPIEAEVVETPSPPPNTESKLPPREEKPSFKDLGVKAGFYDRLIDLMHEANLTPRHLKFCCGGVLVFFLVVILGFVMVPRLLENGLPFGGNDVEPPEMETPGSVSSPPADSGSEEGAVEGPIPLDPLVEPNRVWVDPSVYAGLLLGQPPELIFEGASGVDVALMIGDQDQNPDPTSKFQSYLKELNHIYNLYYVDIMGLLASPGNRTATLDNYVDNFKAAYNAGVESYRDIQGIRATFAAQFEENVPPKEAAEAQFFADIKAFNGGSAERQLIQFIDLNQEQAELRAKYLAFGRLEEMYRVVLESSQRRLKDLELNREALLAGVQVVDVYGSDLDLILKETDLQ